jgi:hypothetical protein
VTDTPPAGQGCHAVQASHRLKSRERIAAIEAFLSAHSDGWQENIFSNDDVRRSFRTCEGDEMRPRFVVGTETLGVQPSKNWSRPLCRRDRDRIEHLLLPEAIALP